MLVGWLDSWRVNRMFNLRATAVAAPLAEYCGQEKLLDWLLVGQTKTSPFRQHRHLHHNTSHQRCANIIIKFRHVKYYLKLKLTRSFPFSACCSHRRCFDPGPGLHRPWIDTLRDARGRAGGRHGYNGDSCGRI